MMACRHPPQEPLPQTDMTLEQAIDHAAEHLTEGWQIRIHIERGSGLVVAERPDSSVVDMYEDEADLSEHVMAAVRLAHDETESEKMHPKLT